MNKHLNNHHQPINHSSSNANDIKPYTEENRKKLARLIMNLFSQWDLDTATQLNLLGLSTSSRALLSSYKKGTKPLPNTRDLFDRAGFLLSIHKSLRILYPNNENIRYTWIKRKNGAFENQTPLELMKNQGIIGLAKIARFLEFQRGR